MRHLVAAFVVLGCAGQANAGFVLWSEDQGGNGHYYGLVMPDTAASSYTWTQARDAAASMVFEGVQGHLATVTSAAENDFLRSNFASQLFDAGVNVPAGSSYAWIGLYAPTPTSNFQWVTGEAFDYSNWAPSEPNFFGSPLWQYVHYWTRDFGGGPSWTWNNEQNDGYNPGYNRYGFFVEFDGPFTEATPAPPSIALLGVGAVCLFVCRRWKGGRATSRSWVAEQRSEEGTAEGPRGERCAY